MLQVLRFLLKITADFLKMLFTIDVGDGMNLGLVLCIVFIFLPLVLSVVNFLKGNKDFCLVETKPLIPHLKTEYGVQFLPDECFGAGFYAAVLKKIK